MGALFSSPSPPAPPPPPPPPPVPEIDDPAVEEARHKLRLSQRRRLGRGRTILTSGLGDPGAAPVSRPGLKTTLGGD